VDDFHHVIDLATVGGVVFRKADVFEEAHGGRN
jgi:hypothetical protein